MFCAVFVFVWRVVLCACHYEKKRRGILCRILMSSYPVLHFKSLYMLGRERVKKGARPDYQKTRKITEARREFYYTVKRK